MVRQADLETWLPVGPWRKGLNNWIHPSEIGDDEVPDTLDVDFGSDGTFRPRETAQATLPDTLASLVRGFLTLHPDGPNYQGSPGLVSAAFTPDGAWTLGVSTFDLYAPVSSATAHVTVRQGTYDDALSVPYPVHAARRNCAYTCWEGVVYIWRTTPSTGEFADLAPVKLSATPAFTNPEGDNKICPTDEQLPVNVPAFVNGSGDGWIPPSRVLLTYSFGAGEWLVSAQGQTIRWSYPLSTDGTKGFQNFREVDVIHLPLGANDEITALRQIGDTLLVFTRETIWNLTGGSPYQWAPQLLSRGLGVADQHATVHAGPWGIAFFDTDTASLWVFDGQQFTDLWKNRLRVQRPSSKSWYALGYAAGIVSVATDEFDDENVSAQSITYRYNLHTGSISRYSWGADFFFNAPDPSLPPSQFFVNKPIPGLSYSQPIMGDNAQAWLAHGDEWDTVMGQETGIVGFLVQSHKVEGRMRTKRVLSQPPDARVRWRRAVIQGTGLMERRGSPPVLAQWYVDEQLVPGSVQISHDPPVEGFPISPESSEQGIVSSPRRRGRTCSMVLRQPAPAALRLTRVIFRFLPGTRRL